VAIDRRSKLAVPAVLAGESQWCRRDLA